MLTVLFVLLLSTVYSAAQCAADRAQCAGVLDLLRLPLNLSVVLGSLEDVGPSARRQALAATGRFVVAVDAVRKL